jgi:uncharacterized protein (DUF2147 family)
MALINRKMRNSERYGFSMRKDVDTLGRIRVSVYLIYNNKNVRKLTLAEVRTAMAEDEALAADADLKEYIERKNAEGLNRAGVNQYTKTKVSTELKGRELYLYLEGLMFNNKNRI